MSSNKTENDVFAQSSENGQAYTKNFQAGVQSVKETNVYNDNENNNLMAKTNMSYHIPDGKLKNGVSSNI